MVLFNYSTKEITAKIVYYGPGLCGKTTNLQFIYENLPKSINKGKMLSLATKTDRTLFFDFLPIDLGTIRGMRTRLQLYTVPGQVFYNTTRKLVLKGADGIVFVADSQKRMIDANLESFKNLEENLIEHGMNLSEIPLIIQFNKRDLPEVATVEELNAALNKFNIPIYEAVATTGIGVHETLKAMTRLVLNSLKERYAEKRAQRGLKPAQAVQPAPAMSEQPTAVPRTAVPSGGAAVEPPGRTQVSAHSMPAAGPQAAPMSPASSRGPTTIAGEITKRPDPALSDAILLEADDEPVLELVDEGLEILQDEGLLEIDDGDSLAAGGDADLFGDGPDREVSEAQEPSPFSGMEMTETEEEPLSPFSGMEMTETEEEPLSPFSGMEMTETEEEPSSPFSGMEMTETEEEPSSPFSGMTRATSGLGLSAPPRAASSGPASGTQDGDPPRVQAGTMSEHPAGSARAARPPAGNQEIMLPIDLAIGDKTISFQLRISLDIAPGGEVQVASIEGGR